MAQAKTTALRTSSVSPKTACTSERADPFKDTEATAQVNDTITKATHAVLGETVTSATFLVFGESAAFHDVKVAQ